MADEIKSKRVCVVTVVISLAVFLLYSAVVTAFSQSTSLDYPAAVTTNQIAGRIRAREIGDSRLTSHYYLFESGTGDVFLNIETSNLEGDIDIYTAGSLKPLLKASVYAGSYATVMQRDLYLRLPSRLILRVEGRTPNDDPADYKIVFSGVFKPLSAAAAAALPRDPGTPKVTGGENPDGSRVSATGAIIVKPKPPAPKATPTPTPKAAVARNTVKTDKPKKLPTVDPNAKPPKPKLPAPAPEAADRKDTDRKKDESAKKPEKPKTEKPKDISPSGKKPSDAAKPAKPVKTPADPLAEVFLVIEMKNGTKLRYAMSDVFQVNVDGGVVKIILKNGKLVTRSLLEIEEMKIGQ